MSVDQLTAIVAPPKVPVAAVGKWSDVESSLGTSLPDDYKRYVETFGTGCLSGFFWVFSPFSENVNLNLASGNAAALRALDELKARFPEEVDYPLFPRDGGLLAWGATDNGDVLYWQTLGSPDDWHVVVNASRDPRTELYRMGMTTFLAKALTGGIISEIFPDDLARGAPSFAV